MKNLILFDIDGTLLLTGGAGKISFNQVFSDLYQIEGAWQNIHPDGRTDPSLIQELFETNLGRQAREGELSRVKEAYIRSMPEALKKAEQFRLMPGVKELLSLLAEREIGLMGLATGNFEATAYQKLEHAGLGEFFSFGGFGSDHYDRLKLTRLAVARGQQKMGRLLEPEDVFLIGDTPNDIRCGKLLGLTTIGVATGSTPMKELKSYRPDFLLEDLSALEEVITIFS